MHKLDLIYYVIINIFIYQLCSLTSIFLAEVVHALLLFSM